MERDVNSLPDEVLEHIFSGLQPHDKISASSTCKRWMQIFNDFPKLLEDVRFNIDFAPKAKYEHLSAMSRKFCFFNLFRVIIDQECINFLKKIAPQIRRLTFFCCKIHSYDEETLEKIENCTDLRELKIYGGRAFMLFSHLPNLKVLHLEEKILFSDRNVAHISEIAPLTLVDFKVWVNSRKTGVSPQYLENFIQSRRMTLQSLSLKMVNLKGEHIEQLSQMQGLELRRFDLTSYSKLNSSILHFCSKQRNIVALHLRGDINLTDSTMDMICRTLPKLKELTLPHCEVDTSVQRIFQLEQLLMLDLTACDRISKVNFRKSLSRVACHDLEHLNLKSADIDDDILSRLLPQLPKLQELNISHCRITDFSVCVISMYLTSLRRLNMSYCAQISDLGLLGISGFNFLPVPLSKIKGLEELKLSRCERLTAEGLYKAIRFNSLRRLNLDGCVHLSSLERMNLKEVNPNLRSLKNREANFMMEINWNS